MSASYPRAFERLEPVRLEILKSGSDVAFKLHLLQRATAFKVKANCMASPVNILEIYYFDE